MIWLLGDTHGDFDHIRQALDVSAAKPMAAVFLGDLEAPIAFEDCVEDLTQAGVAVHWIRGNHDTDSDEYWRNLSTPAALASNIDGKVTDIGGVRISGLGGVFRGEIWHPEVAGGSPSYATYAAYEKALRNDRKLKQRLSRKDLIEAQAVPEQTTWDRHTQDASRAGKLLKHQSTIFPDVYQRLSGMRADILVSHEAPTCHPHGFAAIDYLAHSMGVKVLFHGHHHDSLDYSSLWNSLKFRAYGVGFRGITSYSRVTGDVSIVMPGDFNASSRYRQTHIMERL